MDLHTYEDFVPAGCNYLSLPEKPTSGNKVVIYKAVDVIKHTPIIYIVVTVIHIYCVCICLILVTFRYRGTGLNPAVSHNSIASPVLGYISKGQYSSWVTQRNSIFGVSRHIDIMVKLWPSVTPNVYQGVSKLKKGSPCGLDDACQKKLTCQISANLVRVWSPRITHFPIAASVGLEKRHIFYT